MPTRLSDNQIEAHVTRLRAIHDGLAKYPADDRAVRAMILIGLVIDRLHGDNGEETPVPPPPPNGSSPEDIFENPETGETGRLSEQVDEEVPPPGEPIDQLGDSEGGYVPQAGREEENAESL